MLCAGLLQLRLFLGHQVRLIVTSKPRRGKGVFTVGAGENVDMTQVSYVDMTRVKLVDMAQVNHVDMTLVSHRVGSF